MIGVTGSTQLWVNAASTAASRQWLNERINPSFIVDSRRFRTWSRVKKSHLAVPKGQFQNAAPPVQLLLEKVEDSTDPNYGGWKPGSRVLADYIDDVDRWETNPLTNFDI